MINFRVAEDIKVGLSELARLAGKSIGCLVNGEKNKQMPKETDGSYRLCSVFRWLIKFYEEIWTLAGVLTE